jgi:hypothetical protein
MSSRSESAAQVLALKAELRRAVRSEPRESEPVSGLRQMPARARAWFVLAPGWTSTLASTGFPLDSEGRATGQVVVDALDGWAEKGLLERAPTGPPWDDTWYALPASMTPIALQSIVEESSEGATLLQRELVAIGDHIAPSAEAATPPPALRRFLVLARAAALWADDDPVVAVGDEIDDQVRAAIDTAERAGAAVSPEGARWVEAATPLVPLFGRDIIVAVERARHRLEAFERRRRDEGFLRRYLPRPALEQAFVDLIQDGRDDAWALHYLGEGGFGKTMLVRRITSHYARELELLTSRIDFDHLNPDYPARAPGLLLLALAEDLQLSDDTLVAEQLREFNAVIGSAHQRIEGGDRSGARASPEQVRSLMDEAVLRFAGILQTVAERRRPVFVLDTCEELARIRPTGELPDAVTRTFDLLEQLQGEVKDLRVVFSGRRPLASEGDNWTDPRSPLPKRSWLRRARVTGFDREEATRFLDQYSRERPIDRRYHDRILELSRTELTVAGGHRPLDASVLVAQSRREAVERETRYNPFELDLYAAWLTAADIEDPERLLSADEHQYTRERIVQRVNERIQPWLPIVAQLGHLDQALLERLAWEPETIVANVVSEITAQEWIEPERGAVWTDVPDAPSGTETTWVVHPRVQQRLARFFRAEEEESWRRARTRLRSILPDFVLERPWSALVPEYFVVAFDVLCDTPDAAAQWWQEVEKKIVRDAAWPWASEVLARLKDQGAPADRDTWSTHPLQAMLLVTEAVVMRRQRFDGRRFTHAWNDALRAADRVPDAAVRALVRYRARAGSIGAIRWHDEPMDQASQFLIEQWLYELPALEALEQAGVVLDIEVLASELALIENLAEIFERVRWESAPAARVLDPMLARYTALKLLLARDGGHPDFRGFLALLEVAAARLLRLRVDLKGSQSATERALSLLPTIAERTEARLDWVPPQSIRMRVQLESMRLTRFTPINVGEFAHGTAVTVDTDRLRAIDTLIGADVNAGPRSHLSVGDVGVFASALISNSVETNRTQQPNCHAHVTVPPLFEVELMALADSGAVREAVAEAEAIVRKRDTTMPLDVIRAAERAYVRIAVKWRLVERGGARQTSLLESTSWQDRTTALTAVAMDRVPAARFTGFPPGRIFRWRQTAADLRAGPLGSERKPTLAERAHCEIDEALEPGLDAEAVRRHVGQAQQIAESRECEALEPELALRARVRLAPWIGKIGSEGSGPTRRIGEMALEEGSLLIGWRPDQARVLLADAVARFESCGDRLGVVLASLGSGLALAKLDRFSEIAGELRRAKQAWDASDGRVPDLLSDSVTDEWRPWADRARILDQLARDKVLNDESRKGLDGMAIDAPWLDSDTAKPQAEFAIGMWGRTILRVSGNVGAVILGLAFAAAGIGVFYKGFVGALGFLGIEGSTTFNVVGFIGTIVLISWLPAVLRGYTRFFERVFLVLKVVDGPKDPVSIEQPLAATFRTVPVPLVGDIELKTPGETDPRVERGAHRWRQPYVRQPRYLESGDSVGRWLNRLLMRAWRLQTRMLVPTSIAGEPWEAFIWEQHTWAPFRQSRYAFMRTSRLDDVQSMWGRATASAGEPFRVRPAIVRAQFAERSDERFLEQVWKRRTTEDQRFTTEVRPGEARNDPTAENGRAGLVHLLAPIRDDSRGLSIQGRFPSELITEFPDARLFILQRPPRSEDRRVESDRLDAWRARLFAAQLFDAGAPAVIVIPSLTTKLAMDVMGLIAEAALGGHRQAVEPLAFAVREGQERIFDTLSTADEAAAIETAFDVCFYARAVVNLSVRDPQ